MKVKQLDWCASTSKGPQTTRERVGGWAEGRALRTWLRKQSNRVLAWLDQPSDAIFLIDDELLRKDADELWGSARFPWDTGTGMYRLRKQERVGRSPRSLLGSDHARGGV
jgi:hypothetical protein